MCSGVAVSRCVCDEYFVMRRVLSGILFDDDNKSKFESSVQAFSKNIMMNVYSIS